MINEPRKATVPQQNCVAYHLMVARARVPEDAMPLSSMDFQDAFDIIKGLKGTHDQWKASMNQLAYSKYIEPYDFNQ